MWFTIFFLLKKLKKQHMGNVYPPVTYGENFHFPVTERVKTRSIAAKLAVKLLLPRQPRPSSDFKPQAIFREFPLVAEWKFWSITSADFRAFRSATILFESQIPLFIYLSNSATVFTHRFLSFAFLLSLSIIYWTIFPIVSPSSLTLLLNSLL